MPTALDYRPTGADPLAEDKRDVMRELRGIRIAIMVRELIEAANSPEVKPNEATEYAPDSVRAMNGEAYGSLTHTTRLSGGVTILPGGKSDSSFESELHDTTLAHLLGTALEPLVKPKRGKAAMADALTELADYRWAATGFESTAERLLTDARLRGTCGAKTFRDTALGVARTTWIPTRNLIIDGSCEGDLERTKFRGEKTFVYRSELRRMLKAWGKDEDIADRAGYNDDIDHRSNDPLRSSKRELEHVSVTDFYWSDGNFRRHIILVQGIEEPVWDVDRWPYELPPGRWPINVFPWNALPNMVWGASDHKLCQLWQEGISWMQRFLLDSAAEAAKVVAAYDRSIGDPDVIQRVFGDLRQSYSFMPMNLLEVTMAGKDIEKLTKFFNTPTSVDKLQEAVTMSREIVSRALGLEEMAGRLENPGIDPPRLARRMARWRKFLACVLEAESCVDMTVIPRRALVALRTDGNDPTTGKPVKVLQKFQWLDLTQAESLEKNSLPHAIKRGLTAEQWDPATKREKELRLDDGIDDESQVEIKEPGIARYVSRRMLLDYWEGNIPGVARRATSEYTFQVNIVGSLEASDQAAQRASNALQQIGQIADKLGMQEATLAWGDEFDKVSQENANLEAQGQRGKALPTPPRMLTVTLSLLQDFLRATGAENGRALAIRPEDVAKSLKLGKDLMDAQAKAAAEAEAAAQPQEDPRKMELEVAKLQIELQRLQLQAQKAQADVAKETLQAQTELVRHQWELKKVQLEELKAQMEHQREMAELPYRLEQTAARTASTIAQKDRAVAAAQTEVLRAQQQESQAELQAQVTVAEAAVKMAEANLKTIEAETMIAENEAKANTPADTKEALAIAQAQKLIQDTTTSEKVGKAKDAEAIKSKALADQAKANAAMIRRSPPKMPSGDGKKSNKKKGK